MAFARAIGVLMLGTLASGCATYGTVLVNDNLKMVRCGATGRGAVGIAMAAGSHDNCVANLRSAGYMSLDEAGVTGVSQVDVVDRLVRVTVVKEGSPAARAGIVPGDFLISIDNLPVSGPPDAVRRSFGRAGTRVALVVRHNGQDRAVELTRASYPSVFGTGGVPSTATESAAGPGAATTDPVIAGAPAVDAAAIVAAAADPAPSPAPAGGVPGASAPPPSVAVPSAPVAPSPSGVALPTVPVAAAPRGVDLPTAVAAGALGAPMGTEYRGTVEVGGAKVPLLEGTWQLVGRGATSGAENGISLVRVENGRLAGIVRIYTAARPSTNGYSAFNQCNRADVVFSSVIANVERGLQDCWLINHFDMQEGRANANQPHSQQSYAYLDQHGIALPGTMIVGMHRLATLSNYLVVWYQVNPELAGFAPPTTTTWSASDWHRDRIAQDPRRMAFIESFKATHAQYQDQLRQGFARDPVRVSRAD